jgi:hypothetical protein
MDLKGCGVEFDGRCKVFCDDGLIVLAEKVGWIVEPYVNIRNNIAGHNVPSEFLDSFMGPYLLILVCVKISKILTNVGVTQASRMMSGRE